MSGQSNNSLRVCDVKIRKWLPGHKWGAFLGMHGLMACRVKQFKFFAKESQLTFLSSCCKQIFTSHMMVTKNTQNAHRKYF